MLAAIRKVFASILGGILGLVTLGLVEVNISGKPATEGLDPRPRAGLSQPGDGHD